MADWRRVAKSLALGDGRIDTKGGIHSPQRVVRGRQRFGQRKSSPAGNQKGSDVGRQGTGQVDRGMPEGTRGAVVALRIGPCNRKQGADSRLYFARSRRCQNDGKSNAMNGKSSSAKPRLNSWAERRSFPETFPAIRISAIDDGPRCCPSLHGTERKVTPDRNLCITEMLPPFRDCTNEEDGCRCGHPDRQVANKGTRNRGAGSVKK